MTEEHDNGQRLDPDEAEVGELLSRGAPFPPVSFRVALGRHLQELDPGWGPRPEHLLATVWGYLALGLLLIALAALAGTGVL